MDQFFYIVKLPLYFTTSGIYFDCSFPWIVKRTINKQVELNFLFSQYRQFLADRRI